MDVMHAMNESMANDMYYRNASSATAALYLRAATGYWGKPTATVDWCEGNYEQSEYIAEFWNTVSNLLFVVLGMYGLRQAIREGFEWRFRLQFISVMVTGLGSAMFHGTLQLVHQQCDETPMIWGILLWIYIMFDGEIKAMGIPEPVVIAFLTSVGVGFAVLHAIYHFTVAFQLLFGALAWMCLFRLVAHYHTVTDPRAKAVARSFLYTTIGGFCMWMLDYHCCHQLRLLPVNPQGHAWWHILTGVGTYHGPVFMQYVRAEQLQKKAEIRDVTFGIHTIVIHTGDQELHSAKAKTL